MVFLLRNVYVSRLASNYCSVIFSLRSAAAVPSLLVVCCNVYVLVSYYLVIEWTHLYSLSLSLSRVPVELPASGYVLVLHQNRQLDDIAAATALSIVETYRVVQWCWTVARNLRFAPGSSPARGGGGCCCFLAGHLLRAAAAACPF